MAMTLASVRTLVRAMVEFDPETYITTDPDLNLLINQRADAFAIAAKAFLSRTSVVVAAVVAPGPYAINLRAFGTIGLTDATDVWIDGRQLQDLGPIYRPGPTSAAALADRFTDYIVSAPGTVAHWSSLSPDLIELFPAPKTQVTVTIAGTGLHGAMLTDADVTRFPVELDRAFCNDVAAELIGPRASGSTLERYSAFRSVADAAAAAYKKRAEESTEGRTVRGAKKSGLVRRVGLGGRY